MLDSLALRPRRVGAALIAALALLISGASLDASPPATSGAPLSSSDVRAEPPLVREITVEGLRRVDPTGVLRRLLTRPGTRLSPSVVSEDLKRVFQMDFFEDVRVEASPCEDQDNCIDLHFVIEERPAIRAVNFVGHDKVKLDDIKKVVDIPSFEIVNIPKINRNLQKIRDLYRDQGYHLADVSYELLPVEEGLVDLAFQINERAKIMVKRISFLGNRHLSDSQLRGAMMGTKEGNYLSFLTRAGTFKREYFEQDLRILRDFYAQHGFITARIDDPVVTLARNREFLYITIHVVEGRRYRVGDVRLQGDFLGDDAETLAEKLALDKGDVFSSANVRADVELIGGHYRNQGYAHANVSNDYELVEPDDDSDEPIVNFVYILQKGQRVRFGRIYMMGNDTTRDLVIRREMTFGEGDIYSESALRSSRARIYRLGFFEEVDLRTRRGAHDDFMDVVVQVQERQTGTFQVGAGFSSLESFIATAQISKENFMGQGQTVSFQAMLSSIRSLFTIRFHEPHFFDTNFSFSINLYNFQQQYDDFARGATGGDITWGYWITTELLASISYKLEQVEVTRGGIRGRSPPLANLFDAGRTSSLRLSLIYDSRDNRMFPTDGWHLTGSAEHAATYLGSQNEFTKLLFKGNRYFPLWLGMVLRLNATAGWVFSERPQGVPIFERFFVGGIFDVRGFRRFSLGPRLQTGCERSPDSVMCPFNKGGNKQLIFNAEVEFPIFAPVGIRGVVFLDAGNAFNDGDHFDLLGLRTSWGFGIRWWSPMGPLRFEWGFPFRPKPGEDRYVFEFTIGSAF